MISGWPSRATTRPLAPTVLVFALASLLVSPSASTRPLRSDAVAQARALANAMYPSLAGQDLRAQVLADLYYDTDPQPLNEFRYVIMPGTDARARDLLGVYVTLVDDDGRIGSCTVAGDYVNTTRFFDLWPTLEAHPEWSEAQDSEALRTAGAEFGPWNREGFLAQTLPRLRALGPHWGRLTTWTAAFEMRYREGEQPQPVMKWRMEVALNSPRGTRRYRLLFEPFEGKLVHLRTDR